MVPTDRAAREGQQIVLSGHPHGHDLDSFAMSLSGKQDTYRLSPLKTSLHRGTRCSLRDKLTMTVPCGAVSRGIGGTEDHPKVRRQPRAVSGHLQHRPHSQQTWILALVPHVLAMTLGPFCGGSLAQLV